MKKLRFFGLLAATVLLAFALVVACSNGSTEPPVGPGGPEEPNGPPAYSIPPGGTGPGPGTQIPGAVPTGVRLDRTVLSLKVGATKPLTPTLVPAGAVGEVKWEADDAGTAAVSTTGVVVGVAADSGKPKKVGVKAQAYAYDSKGEATVKVGPPAICMVTVYEGEILDITSGAELALLGWDLIKEFGANALNGQIDTLKDAVVLRIGSLNTAEVKDFATAASQAYLSSSAATPCELIGTTLTYYPVGASSVALNLDTGWKLASLDSSGKVTGTRDGNGVTNGATIVYPIARVAAENWPKLKVDVIPSAEVTVTMPKDIGENLDADKLIATSELGTKAILKLPNPSQVTQEIMVGDLKEVVNDITNTYLVKAYDSSTTIQLLTVVKNAPSPKNYTLTPSWISLPAATQADPEYSEYIVGPLASITHTLRLERNDPYAITAIRITGFPYMEGGQKLFATPSDINFNTIGGDFSTTTSDTQLTWHSAYPATDNNKITTNPDIAAGKRYYAKVVLKPNTGFVFSDNVAITCVGDDPKNAGTEISFATAMPPTKDSDGNLTIVLEFIAEAGKIAEVNLSLAKPSAGEEPTQHATTTASDAGVQSRANVRWTVNGGTWIEAKAKAKDLFIATVEIWAVDGFEFGDEFDDLEATDFAVSSGVVNFPGAGALLSTTDPTAAVSNDRKLLTLVVAFSEL
jgi:hypothetical protein